MEVACTVIPIHEQTDVAEARRRGAQRASLLGFDELTIGRVGLAVTEAATNLLKHAGGGETWIISGKPGANAINGKGGTGFIQKRGDANDTITNAANYTKALK